MAAAAPSVLISLTLQLVTADANINAFIVKEETLSDKSQTITTLKLRIQNQNDVFIIRNDLTAELSYSLIISSH
ncbi:Hypothetical protein SMAX5B_020556 [Scophthalmus maximus]|uniref:Uncharacterized protein n=1 Tax=Scophthalmus maximus TaxID=52904 RepID=A0A2U9CNL9_SCOMX|nr:Hypothetical protein SMAX5B_020556 [Scophthalmus maximus]KAF0025919.1 hypothetical protein F2P81_022800 [Scophthalmus maximus]